MSAMFYRRALLLYTVCVCSVSGAPRVLSTFSQVVDYATHGAPIMVSVNHTFCTVNLPKSIPAYSFTERLDFAFYADNAIRYNRETPVNGTRLMIHGPAIRLIIMHLDSTGQAKFEITDTNWNGGAVVTQGSMTCRMGSALRVTATGEKGKEFTDYLSVMSALEGGYRVFTFIDLQNCTEKSPMNRSKLRATDVQIFGEVIDHRFSPGGNGADFAFSKQVPFLNGAFRFERGYFNVKSNLDGSVDIYYWEFDPRKTIPPRHHFQCTLGKNTKYFQQP